MTIFSILTGQITTIIYIVAIVETCLAVAILWLIRTQGIRLKDATDNMVKGFVDAPDRDSSMSLHEKIESSLRFIINKIQVEPKAKEIVRQNVGKIAERSSDNRYFGIEVYSSMMSTLVQVFPLLGILGTILAISSQTIGTSGTLDPQALTSAFVVAMDTTILGIGFAVLFMLAESVLQPRIERTIVDSKNYKEVLTAVYLS
jgi:biopolymer transport protein ExbB/TolQ